MLTYTNRFLTLATLIRNLHSRYNEHTEKEGVLKQIKNLRLRLRLIRSMQAFGVMSLFLCVLSMFFVYKGFSGQASISFAVSLVLMMISLCLSLWEINISTLALEIELSDMELQKDFFISYIKERFEKEE